MTQSKPRRPRAYSLAETATMLGISRQTLYAWISEGGCPAERVAGQGRQKWRIVPGEVVRWRTEIAAEDALSRLQGGPSGEVSRAEADRRRGVARAILAEAEAERAVATAVLKADVERHAATFAEAIRAALHRAAPTIAERAAVLTSPSAIQQAFEATLNREFATAEAELRALWAREDEADSDLFGRSQHAPDEPRQRASSPLMRVV